MTGLAEARNIGTSPRALVFPPPPPPMPPALDSLLDGRQSFANRQSVQLGSKQTGAEIPEGFSTGTTCIVATTGQNQDLASRSANRGVMAGLLQGLEEGDLNIDDVLSVLEGGVSELPAQQLAADAAISTSATVRTPAVAMSLGSPEVSGRPAIDCENRISQRASSTSNRSIDPNASLERTSLSTLGCRRCFGLDKQLRAVAKALSGISERIFNWSLNAPLQPQQRSSLWRLVVQYIDPFVSVDSTIAVTCNNLTAAISNQTHTILERVGQLRPEDVISEDFASVRPLETQTLESRGLRVSKSMSLFGLRCHARHPDVVKADVFFDSSGVARKISGSYHHLDGFVHANRPVYVNGRFRMLFRGRAWIIKASEDSSMRIEPLDDATEVLAYVEDSAGDPWSVTNHWRVADGKGGYSVDYSGKVRPAMEFLVGEQEGKLGWRCSASPPEHVLVQSVESRGWAASFGLRAGDELIEIDHRRVDTMSMEEFARASRLRPQVQTFAWSPVGGEEMGGQMIVSTVNGSGKLPVEGYLVRKDVAVQVEVGEMGTSPRFVESSSGPMSAPSAMARTPSSSQKNTLAFPQSPQSPSTHPKQERSELEKRVKKFPIVSDTTRGDRQVEELTAAASLAVVSPRLSDTDERARRLYSQCLDLAAMPIGKERQRRANEALAAALARQPSTS
eukprot:TRINITY_DN54553_c0_g1_i1.p1 TRINITY_DN54553_c0_g1~~TRINITY_DN54553_c0_g1_i1.p1  ORF type:complete len:678 (-),score=91.53 TRINITY_DN54553_c0_g1_i1:13-2046(-)